MDHQKCVVVWEDPPEDRRTQLEIVLDELRSRPNTWAKIYSGPWSLISWYTGLHGRPDVEVRTVLALGASNGFGPRDVYARYIGKERGDGTGSEG